VLQRWPVLCFFAIVYALSGLALLVIGLPHMSGGSHHGGSTTALAVFPVMVVGVGLAGVG
jgi:hypothetical protein